MALFIFGQVHSAYMRYSAISSTIYWISCGILVLYVITIVFGRIYTGMHSFTDCGIGVTLGAAIWAVYLLTSDTVERWLESGSWIGKAPCCRFRLLDLLDTHSSAARPRTLVSASGSLPPATRGRLPVFRRRDRVRVRDPRRLFSAVAFGICGV